jgi:hypothetical protein
VILLTVADTGMDEVRGCCFVPATAAAKHRTLKLVAVANDNDVRVDTSNTRRAGRLLEHVKKMGQRTKECHAAAAPGLVIIVWRRRDSESACQRRDVLLPSSQHAGSVVLGLVLMTRSLVCGMPGVSTMRVVVMRRTGAFARLDRALPAAKKGGRALKIWTQLRFSPLHSTPLPHGRPLGTLWGWRTIDSILILA